MEIEENINKLKKTWYEKYAPLWYQNMNTKSKFITIFVMLLLLISIVIVAYMYIKAFVLEHIPEFSGILLVVLLMYLIPKTDIYSKFTNWLFIKYKNLKIFLLMLGVSVVFFLVNFKVMLYKTLPFLSEKVIDNFVIVSFVYLISWLYMKLFSEHKTMKYIKHFILLMVVLLFRSIFQHHVSPVVEQLLNGLVLFIMVVMLLTYIYESIFIKDKAEKKRITFVLQIILFSTLIFSPYMTNILIAKKRIDTIDFVEIETLPTTTYDVPVDEKLANIWIDQKNTQNSAATIPDPILHNGSFIFMSDSYSINFWDYYIPLMQKPTQAIKMLETNSWNMKVNTIKNNAVYSEGLLYGHNSHSAVAKRFNFLEYFTDTTENAIKFVDQNKSFYTVELVSTLSDYLTPYSVPKNIYVIKDSKAKSNFLFGAGEKLKLEDAAKKYPFLEHQQIVPLNVIKEVVDSSQLLTGWSDRITNKNLLVADVDKFKNVIIERLYTTIYGKEGVFAHVQLVAKKVVSGRIVNGKKQKIKAKGKDVLASWFIPLFYTGDEKLTVYYFDNKRHGYTYPAMSKMDSSLLGEMFSTGYEVFGKTSVIRDENLYVLSSRVKINDGVYAMTPNYVLYSFKTNKQYSIASPDEMEKVIAEELE